LALVAVSGVLVWWGFLRLGRGEAPSEAETTAIPTVLLAETTTTQPPVIEVADTACPGVGTDSAWETFKADPARSGCTTAPAITTPRILWAVEVGVQGWLNNPVIVGNTVYVGSAGRTQLESDIRDRVYALDLSTGELKWSFEASLDVNGVSATEEMVVAGGDEGLVWGIDPATGMAVWSDSLGVAVFGNPLIIDGKAVVVDGGGNVIAYDLLTGERQWRETVLGAIRGGASSDGELIFVVSEQGAVLAVDLDGTAVWRQTVTAGRSGSSPIQVFAAPTVAGDSVVISLLRDDLYAEPALVALDRRTGELRWRATDAAEIKSDWANIRSSPAVVGDVLVFGEGYSDALVAVGVDDGKTRWAVKAGAYCYKHWASPAVASGVVVVPRFDGGLYAIDAGTQTLLWSIYIGQQDLKGEFPPAYSEDFCQWQPLTGSPVISSPAIAENGTVVVGTLEGYLVAVGDKGP
jgi:outer membrane protein assembly factor BamB